MELLLTEEAADERRPGLAIGRIDVDADAHDEVSRSAAARPAVAAAKSADTSRAKRASATASRMTREISQAEPVLLRVPALAAPDPTAVTAPPGCRRACQTEAADPVSTSALHMATPAPPAERFSIRADTPSHEAALAEKGRSTLVSAVADEDEAVIRATGTIPGPEPAWLEDGDGPTVTAVWPQSYEWEVAPIVPLAWEDPDPVVVVGGIEYASLPEDGFESRQGLVEAVGTELRPAIELQLDELQPEQAETARELVADLTLMIKERHRLPDEAVEEQEVLEQVIAQLSAQLLACVGEAHDEEAVNRFIAEITRATATADAEIDGSPHDEGYLNRMGTHEYKALDRTSMLGSLAGFIRQKLQLHLELARYSVQACVA